MKSIIERKFAIFLNIAFQEVPRESDISSCSGHYSISLDGCMLMNLGLRFNIFTFGVAFFSMCTLTPLWAVFEKDVIDHQRIYFSYNRAQSKGKFMGREKHIVLFRVCWPFFVNHVLCFASLKYEQLNSTFFLIFSFNFPSVWTILTKSLLKLRRILFTSSFSKMADSFSSFLSLITDVFLLSHFRLFTLPNLKALLKSVNVSPEPHYNRSVGNREQTIYHNSRAAFKDWTKNFSTPKRHQTASRKARSKQAPTHLHKFFSMPLTFHIYIILHNISGCWFS